MKEHLSILEKRAAYQRSWYARNKSRVRKLLNEYQKSWRLANRDKALAISRRSEEKRKKSGKNKNRHLMRSYGLSPEKFEALKIVAGNKCQVCNRPWQNGYGRHVIDHCHKTGKVRGILCGPCNRALGLLGDDENRIKSLLKYLCVAYE